MDEYRPYPAEQPDEEAEPSSPAADYPEQRVPAPARSRVEGTVLAEEVEDRAANDGHERPDRVPPNLDHPGGHLTGTVARLNRPRRFGFLRTEDGMEVFFHASALESGPNSFDSLRNGQPVEFDCHQDEQGRGLAASHVQVVGPPPAEPQRPPRPPREERRQTRAKAEPWHVVVLQDRHDSPAHSQLERLLNERNVKPGQFAVTLHERGGATECWVAYHTGEEPAGKR
jgi:cold shock CspA family protein